MNLLPYGDRALLVECDGLASAQRAYRLLTEHRLDGVRELVPGGRSVLVRIDPRAVGLTHLAHWVQGVLGGPDGAGTESTAGTTRSSGEVAGGGAVRIPVVYDGEDLATVAAAWGCSVDEVVARHAASDWVCAFVGFAPGFPYLVPVTAAAESAPLPPVPRRATSRARVPAGSVALAGEYCGVYPRESPGGWQLIGRTEAVLWDPRRDPPALVTSATHVRFEAVRQVVRAVSQELSGATAGNTGFGGGADGRTPEKRHGHASEVGRVNAGGRAEAEGRTAANGRAIGVDGDEKAAAVRVLEPGALMLVQDLGRPGLAAIGIGASGAFDRAAHRLANRLVGNDESAAGLEVLVGGTALALPAGTWIAVTGADGRVTLDDAPVTLAHPVRAERDGAVVRIDPATRGVRYCVAVRGGIAPEPVLGSRSRDTLAALGPDPVSAGDELIVGDAVTGPVPAVDLVPVDASVTDHAELDVRPGPRLDWFTPNAWHRMLDTEWTVSMRADRTGVRLDGPSLDRLPAVVDRELASEGMTAGAIQVSPDGVPTILGPDHPVTGGYPVIAVVTDDTLDRLAQLRPGQRVRLRLATGRP